MKTRHASHYYGLVALAASLAATGCQMPQQRDDDARGRTVVTSDGPVKLTPQQRNARYRDAYTIGVQLAQRGEYGLAMGAFEEALNMRPDSTAALFNLGACFEAVGDPMRAIRAYRDVLTRTPQDPDCYANLGTCYIKLYHMENSPAWRKMALSAWRQSLSIHPDQPHLEGYIARVEAAE